MEHTLAEMLTWVGSHSKRLSRPGFEQPNHLSRGNVKVFKGAATENIALDAQGGAQLTLDDSATRVEIYDSLGNLLFTADV